MIYIIYSFDHLFVHSLINYTPRNELRGYNIFNISLFLCQSNPQSCYYYFFFHHNWNCETEFRETLKLWWTYCDDRRYSMIWRWTWNLFNERDRIFLYIFSRLQSNVVNEPANVLQMWQLLIDYVYPIITNFRLWFSVWMPITNAWHLAFIMCSAFKQCLRLGYVSLHTFSYILYLLIRDIL